MACLYGQVSANPGPDEKRLMKGELAFPRACACVHMYMCACMYVDVGVGVCGTLLPAEPGLEPTPWAVPALRPQECGPWAGHSSLHKAWLCEPTPRSAAPAGLLPGG